MNNKVRVGFLGAGNLNSIQHFPNIAASPDAEFYGVCDLNREQMEKKAGPYKPKLMTEDFEELINNKNIDIIWIATRPHLQTDLARRALKAGKNVFVEKPMADAAETCLELGRLAKKKGLKLFTGFNRRYAPAYVDVTSILQKMKTPPMMTYRLADDSNGRGSDIFVSSQLLDEACHAFDILNFFAGADPVEVITFNVSQNNDLVSIRYANGAVASLTSAIKSSMAWPKERLEIIMDNSAVSVEDFVELQTANVPGWGSMTKRYEGFEYPGWLSGYKEKMQWEGLSAVLAFRRRWQEYNIADGMPKLDHKPETDKIRGKLVEAHKPFMPPVNYMVNKGWCNADHSILRHLRAGEPTNAAGAVESARSIAVAEAAMKSSKSGRLVKLDPKSWKI